MVYSKTYNNNVTKMEIQSQGSGWIVLLVTVIEASFWLEPTNTENNKEKNENFTLRKKGTGRSFPSPPTCPRSIFKTNFLKELLSKLPKLCNGSRARTTFVLQMKWMSYLSS